VLGGLWAVEVLEDKIFIAPYRKTSIKVRAYLFEEKINISFLF